MDEATCARVFDPFFTTKPDGTGLGLTVSYRIVTHHRGCLLVESAPGRGTRARMLLPLAPAPIPHASSTAKGPAAGRATRRVLLADDEAMLRAALARMLERAGYEVQAAPDGEAAVAELARDPRAFDLVVLDMRMPRLGGVAALERMRALRPDLPCVFVTGYAPEGDVVVDSARVLLKPFTHAELLRAIEAVLA
jgi:CheY-like chemotaxis protein